MALIDPPPVIEKMVVVALFAAVELPIVNIEVVVAAPELICRENFADGVVDPMPTLPEESILILSRLFVPKTRGAAGLVPITRPFVVPDVLLNAPTSPHPPKIRPYLVAV